MMNFPDPRHAPHDIIAIGGDLEPHTLIDAYGKGIFPWPIEDYPLCWFSPHWRAILFFNELHVSRSLERARRKTHLRFSIDESFGDVIELCSSAPRSDHGTWILPEIKEAYVVLYEAGSAHSIEAWNGDRLVGGLYGVEAGGVFSGESMFHLEPNASKLALLFLVDHMSARGSTWLDVQIMTPHMKRLGTRLVVRSKYLDLLEATHEKGLELFPGTK